MDVFPSEATILMSYASSVASSILTLPLPVPDTVTVFDEVDGKDDSLAFFR